MPRTVPAPQRNKRGTANTRPPHERERLRICGLAAVRALFECDPARVELDQRPWPGDRNDAAMQHGSGDAREFRTVRLAIGLAGLGQDPAERPRFARDP